MENYSDIIKEALSLHIGNQIQLDSVSTFKTIQYFFKYFPFGKHVRENFLSILTDFEPHLETATKSARFSGLELVIGILKDLPG